MAVRAIAVVLGLALFAVGGYFFLQARQAERETDALRDLTSSPYESDATGDESMAVGAPEPVVEAPPAVEPYQGSNACVVHWGLQLRQYCSQGDAAVLDIVEGDTQADAMASLQDCLDESLQRMDVRGKDLRPMDSEVPLTETQRKQLSCAYVNEFGSSPRFDRFSLYDMFQEKVETGGVARLSAAE